MMGSHEVGDHNRGRPRYALLTMNENRGSPAGTSGILDEVVDFGKLGKQVLRLVVIAGDMEVGALRDDLSVPVLSPGVDSPVQKRDDGFDFMTFKQLSFPRTCCITKKEAVFNLRKRWRSRHGFYRQR